MPATLTDLTELPVSSAAAAAEAAAAPGMNQEKEEAVLSLDSMLQLMDLFFDRLS